MNQKTADKKATVHIGEQAEEVIRLWEHVIGDLAAKHILSNGTTKERNYFLSQLH